MTTKDVPGIDADSSDKTADSHSDGDAGAQGGTDWRKQAEGQLKKNRELQKEIETLRARANTAEQLSKQVAGLSESFVNMELAIAEMRDQVATSATRSDDPDIYGSDPDDERKPSTSYAEQVRSRVNAGRQQTFVQSLNSAYSEFQAAYNADPAIVDTDAWKDALSIYNEGQQSRDPQRLTVALRGLGLAKRERELARDLDDSGDSDDTEIDETTDSAESGDDSDETDKPEAGSKRRALRESGLAQDSSPGGDVAQTDKYANFTPTQLFRAAGKGEGPKRS